MIASRDACKVRGPTVDDAATDGGGAGALRQGGGGADILPRKAQPQLFCVCLRALPKSGEEAGAGAARASSSDPANAETCVEAVTGRAVKRRAAGKEARTSPQNIERRSRNRADDRWFKPRPTSTAATQESTVRPSASCDIFRRMRRFQMTPMKTARDRHGRSAPLSNPFNFERRRVPTEPSRLPRSSREINCGALRANVPEIRFDLNGCASSRARRLARNNDVALLDSLSRLTLSRAPRFQTLAP